MVIPPLFFFFFFLKTQKTKIRQRPNRWSGTIESRIEYCIREKEREDSS
jgi:hypothetical protein